MALAFLNNSIILNVFIMDLKIQNGRFEASKDRITEETFRSGNDVSLTVSTDDKSAASRDVLASMTSRYLTEKTGMTINCEPIEVYEDRAFRKNGETVYKKCSFLLKKK